MAITTLNPYLFFNGDAAEALAFYEQALEAKADGVMHWGDVPGMETPPEYRQRVMHSQLHIGGGLVMVSDCGPGEPVAFGRNVRITLNFSDVAEMTRRFEAMARGGEVTTPLHETFWGATFGMLTDRFGVAWMFDCEEPKPA